MMTDARKKRQWSNETGAVESGTSVSLCNCCTLQATVGVFVCVQCCITAASTTRCSSWLLEVAADCTVRAACAQSGSHALLLVCCCWRMPLLPDRTNLGTHE